jgi:hypothetical protein
MQEPPENLNSERQSQSWSVQRIIVMVASLLGGIIAIAFVVGLLLSLSSPLEATALRIQYLRNIAVIVLALEGILIIGSIAILIMQITRLINLLKKEVRPVLANAQSAVDSAKGAVEFVGDSVAQPIIQTGAFLAGAKVLIRDVGGIRRAIEPQPDTSENDHEEA